MKMKTMSNAVVILAAVFAVGLAGCGSMTPRAKGVSDGSDAGKVDAATGAKYFPGGSLTVKIDGRKTTPARKDGGVQIWAVAAISPTPTVMFIMDEKKLGVCKSVSIAVYPLKKGLVNEGNFYKYTGVKKLAPGKQLRLDKFNHLCGGRMDRNIKKLPKGKYRINLQVNGRKTWDRQYIDTEIK